MTCFFPLKGFRGPNGAWVYNASQSPTRVPLVIPCGQCRGCRLERSRQWAVRCLHEAQLWPSNCFITLTYAPEFLPPNGSLVLSHFQKFLKRLRKKYGANIRFFHCGEYGSKLQRPHYHACLFNFDFDDKKLWKVKNGQKLFTSASLSSLWPYGWSTVGSVSFESAAYVARYILKKVNGDLAEDHYSTIDCDGVVGSRRPEYVTMSRRPGIASGWFEKYGSDVYPSDQVIVRGRPCRPPRFYDNRLKLSDPDTFEIIHAKRLKLAKKHLDNATPERLAVRYEVLKATLRKLPRPYESDLDHV